MKKLILLQEQYIEFLEREVGNVSSTASVHGWVCPKEVYEEGCKLREEIEKLKQ
jgi:hypothetical protein